MKRTSDGFRNNCQEKLISVGRNIIPSIVKLQNTALPKNDPESVVSKAIRERGGYALMPEWETKPANQYLPRRKNEFKE